MHTVESHYLILTPVRTQQNEEIMIIEAIGFSLTFCRPLALTVRVRVFSDLLMQKPFGPCTFLARMRLQKYGDKQSIKTILFTK